MTDYDVSIIGGGLTGLSLAAALAPLPLRVLMIESRPPVTDLGIYDERSLALGFGSRLIYGGIGIWDEVAAKATPINTVHASEQGTLGSTRLQAAAAGVAALGYVVTLRDLATALERRVSTQPNLTRLHGTHLKAVTSDAEHTTLTIEDENGTQVLTSRLLVGADGGRSASRQLLGIDSWSKNYHQIAVVANLTPRESHRNIAFERFARSGPLAMLPLADNRCAMVWSLPPEHAQQVMSMSDNAFMAEVPRHFGFRLGDITATGKRDSFPLKMTLARQLTAQRALVLGNAAHALHPIAGQGLNLALRDVAVLAELLAEYDDPGDDMLLQIYAQRRRPDIEATANYSDSLLQLFSIPSPLLAHLRGAGLIGLDRLPPLKRRLARLGMGFRKPLQGPLFHGKTLKR